MRRISSGGTVLLLFAALSGLWSSCAHPGDAARGAQAITVEISDIPEVYAPMRVVWKITWWDGAAVKSEVLLERSAADPVTATLPLSQHGAEVVVVRAAAHPASGGALAPLGAWGAPPSSRFTLEPDFGRVAGSVLQVARRGLDPALINLKRLHRTVGEECGDQPEILDHQRLVEALGTGEMNRYAIRRRARPGCEVSLPAPVDDVWISHDTTEETIEGVWAGDRCHWIVPVAEGEVRHLWQWLPAGAGAAATLGSTNGVSTAAATPGSANGVADPPAGTSWIRLLTVGRDRNGHAFWFIKEVPGVPGA
ncbi:MAG: hypothetical protein WD492_13375 [Alkalispirochaeta sp.]